MRLEDQVAQESTSPMIKELQENSQRVVLNNYSNAQLQQMIDELRAQQSR